MFFNCFVVSMSQINFKNKKHYFNIFLNKKKHLKNNL
jgi:hypothetical protein